MRPVSTWMNRGERRVPNRLRYRSPRRGLPSTIGIPYLRIPEINWITRGRLDRLYKFDAMLALRTTSPQLTKVRGYPRAVHRAIFGAILARKGRCWAWTFLSGPRGASLGWRWGVSRLYDGFVTDPCAGRCLDGASGEDFQFFLRLISAGRPGCSCPADRPR